MGNPPSLKDTKIVSKIHNKPKPLTCPNSSHRPFSILFAAGSQPLYPVPLCSINPSFILATPHVSPS